MFKLAGALKLKTSTIKTNYMKSIFRNYKNAAKRRLADPTRAAVGYRIDRDKLIGESEFVRLSPPADHLHMPRPYYYTFTMNAKERWIGKTLRHALTEVSSAPLSLCALRCKAGRLRVNNKATTLDSLIECGDVITHRVHYHEWPIRVEAPRIIADTDDFVCVYKPPSVPVHPCGRFRHGSLVYLLSRLYGERYAQLGPVMRLDRLTSGCIVLARSYRFARKFGVMLKAQHSLADTWASSENYDDAEHRAMHKQYVARVRGRFPGGVQWCRAPLEYSQSRVFISAERTLKSRAALTRFELLGYDALSDESVVSAEPITGRTHQIRVHLASLGHAIVNDPIYNEEYMEASGTHRLSSSMIDAHYDEVSQGDVRLLEDDFDPFCAPCRDGELASDERWCEFVKAQPHEIYLSAVRYSIKDIFDVSSSVKHDWMDV